MGVRVWDGEDKKYKKIQCYAYVKKIKYKKRICLRYAYVKKTINGRQISANHSGVCFDRLCFTTV